MTLMMRNLNHVIDSPHSKPREFIIEPRYCGCGQKIGIYNLADTCYMHRPKDHDKRLAVNRNS